MLAAALAGTAGAVRADGQAGTLERLEQEVHALEARVATLESRITMASFMPDLAERFHVMHRAGDAGDWAVASHELQEMQRLTALAPSVDAEKGTLMTRMMAPVFEALDEAVDHGDGKAFDKALDQTINTCNACHAATGSAFVQVTLDVPDTLSMRHPHRLVARSPAQGHHHDMPSVAGAMHHEDAEHAEGHDDSEKRPHTHTQ